MIPLLRTPRLLLRPAAPGDLDPLWHLWTDPDVRRYLWDDRTVDRDEASATLHSLLAMAEEGLGLWIVEPRLTTSAASTTDDQPSTALAPAGTVIGCAGLYPTSTTAEYEPAIAGMLEPLVALGPAWWHRGLATETLSAVLAYAFQTLGVDALAGVTDVPNVASDRMLRRVGFVPFSEGNGPRYRMRNYRLQRAAWIVTSSAATHPPSS
ncbi:MAG TPA: GNAT family N-acetyltransferase [Gemmatimonadaceae bacterium]|nr:GNAT family N-acetyltransferase [Gemmatimonadaceae bacterium]